MIRTKLMTFADSGRRLHRGFSFIELTIVVAILGVVAAIIVPRLTSASSSASSSALQANLTVLQKAIELYAAEHGGQFPSMYTVAAQLTQFTDESGQTSTQKTAACYLGPYLARVPPVPTGPYKGSTTIAPLAGPGVGWIYTQSSGAIAGNITTAPTGGRSGTLGGSSGP